MPLPEDPENCDFLDNTVCLQPFPNDYYTREDATSVTGKRLNLDPEATPANKAGVHISVTDINRGDGFSPGNQIILKVPGLDTPQAFENNDFVSLEDLHAYDDPDQRVLLIDAETGERQPIWAELDSNPTSVDPVKDGDTVISPGGINDDPSKSEAVNLIVRPGEEPRVGAPLHRGVPQPEGCEPTTRSKRRSASGPTGTTCRPSKRSSKTAVST